MGEPRGGGRERWFIDRRDTEIRGLNVMRRIVKVLDGTDAYHTVAYRHQRRDLAYGPIKRLAHADFHRRFISIHHLRGRDAE